MFKENKHLTGRIIAAFLLFSIIPLLKINITPFYSIRIFLIQILLALFFIAIILKSFIQRSVSEFKLSIIDLLLLFFYVLYLSSCFFSSNIPVSFNAALFEFSFIMMYIFIRILFYSDKNRLMHLYTGFISFAVFVMSAWGLMQYFFEIDMTAGLKSLFKTYHFPVIASFGNPNFLAEFLALCLPVTISFFRAAKRKYLFVIFFIIQGLTIYLSYSRLAWAVLAFFMILTIFISQKQFKRILLISYSLLFVICLSFFIYHNKTDSAKTSRVIKSLSFEKSDLFSSRGIIYKTGFKMLSKTPFLGFGAGTFSYHYLDYQGRVADDLGKDAHKYEFLDLEHAHSDFIEIGIEAGFAALFLFVILLLAAIFFGIKIIKGDCDNSFRYIGICPFLFVIFGLWAFPFYLPFSKMIFIFSLAYISAQFQTDLLKIKRLYAVIISSILIINIFVFSYFHARLIKSVIHYEIGLINFSTDYKKSLNELLEGIKSYPYNGHNYFTAGSLLLNHSEKKGFYYLHESLKYYKNVRTYLYLARGYRDFNMEEESRKWYKKLIHLQPDNSDIRKEYHDMLYLDGDLSKEEK